MATLIIKRWAASSYDKPEVTISLIVGNGEARDLARNLASAIPTDGKQHTFEVWEGHVLALRTTSR